MVLELLEKLGKYWYDKIEKWMLFLCNCKIYVSGYIVCYVNLNVLFWYLLVYWIIDLLN